MAVANTGSRSGLITAVVVLTITTIVGIVLYFTENASRRQADKALKESKDLLNVAASSENRLSTEYEDIKANLNGRSVFDVMREQRNNAISMAVGRAPSSEAEVAKAIDDTKKELEKLQGELKKRFGDSGPKIDVTNLRGTVLALNTFLNNIDDTLAAAKAKVDELNKKRDEAVADYAKAVAEKESQIKKLGEDVANAQNVSVEALKKLGDAQKALETSVSEMSKAHQKQLEGFAGEIQNKNNEVERLKAERDLVVSKMAKFRPNPNFPIASVVDATIRSLNPDGTVYIDLGSDNQLVRGTTFEVYAQKDGIPQSLFGDRDNDLPIGTASIQVIEVNAVQSLARVTRLTPGTQIVTGDLCVNLAFDKNVKLKFFVAGQFDLRQAGKPNNEDAEVVRTLIRQFGASTTDVLNADVDFVVIGREPVVKDLTAAENEDPLKRDAHEKAVLAKKAYDETIERARSLTVPVLGQNRFLYFVGYFDLAKQR